MCSQAVFHRHRGDARAQAGDPSPPFRRANHQRSARPRGSTGGLAYPPPNLAIRPRENFHPSRLAIWAKNGVTPPNVSNPLLKCRFPPILPKVCCLNFGNLDFTTHADGLLKFGLNGEQKNVSFCSTSPCLALRPSLGAGGACRPSQGWGYNVGRCLEPYPLLVCKVKQRKARNRSAWHGGGQTDFRHLDGNQPFVIGKKFGKGAGVVLISNGDHNISPQKTHWGWKVHSS